jgi:hypothetical protein
MHMDGSINGARRRLVFAALVGGTVSSSRLAQAGYNLWTNEYTFTRRELESALARKFPYQARYLAIIDVRLTEPRLRFDVPRNRVTVEANAAVTNPLTPGQTFDGILALNSGLRYASAQRAVLLDRPELERFEFAQVPSQYSRQLNTVGAMVAQDLLHEYPLYTFKPEELRFKGREFEPGTITVQSDGIAVQVNPR